MDSPTNIDLPWEDALPTRYQVAAHHVFYDIGPSACRVRIAGVDAEQIATWFERQAAEVRSRALEQTLTAAALGRVQDASTGGDDGS